MSIITMADGAKFNTETGEVIQQGGNTFNVYNPTQTKTNNIVQSVNNTVNNSVANNQINNSLDINTLLNDNRVKQDKGVNGMTMGQWLQGNASLFPKLAQLGYTIDDLINEAYAQVHYNKSAFVGDMTAMPAQQNRLQTQQQNYSPQTQQENQQIPQNKTDNDFIQQIIQLDPYLVEYFKDKVNKENFDRLAPEQQQYMLQLISLKQKNITAGAIVNPNVELEPDKMKEFLTQAQNDPTIKSYYTEQIKSFSDDLTTSISRLQEDYKKSIDRGGEIFKQNLEGQAENEAQAGLSFSSGRNERLKRTITNENYGLTDASIGLARNIQDVGKQSERTIGSSSLGNLGLSYNAPNYQASEAGYTPTGTRSLFTPQGNLTGTLQAQRSVDEINRQNQLAAAENAKRTADYNFRINSIYS